ncbi:MAG: bacteriophage abortive infection AbiH family protein [Lachnospiraceae bacterium]|nr:bacteriophage abortive infection AbiH family protein [Lachnospiraceae bacterium]
MNRVIIIGNGFDKAHGLATGYRDFIDSYWTNVSYHIFNGYKRWESEHYGGLNDPSPYKDEFILFEVFYGEQYKTSEPSYPQSCSTPYDEVRELIAMFNDGANVRYEGSVRLTFKNKFFEHISERCSLTNWVDIENEYYGKLKELLAENDALIRHEKVRMLNQDFDAVKKQLESYLTQVVNDAKVEQFPSIREAFDSLITPSEVALEKRKLFVDSILSKIVTSGETNAIRLDKQKDLDYLFCHSQDEERRYYVMKHLSDKHFQETNCTPSSTLILNFNYTQTAKQLYARDKDGIINIHGELGNQQNPTIFGYGDELDDDYKRIEKLQDNDFLENIKSVHYHETDSYRRVLNFIESDAYQVITMGHSCGNSDRTLLNTLFEHPNCISVKVFYHQLGDGTDNYSDLIRNISRNFNDKAAMRDKVVNKKYCSPLVPVSVDEKPHLPDKE